MFCISTLAGVLITDDGKIFTTDSNVTLNNSGVVNAWVTSTIEGNDGNSSSNNLVPVELNDNIIGASVHTSYQLTNGGQIGETTGIIVNSTSDIIPTEGTNTLGINHLTVNSGRFISPLNMTVREFSLHGGEFTAPESVFTVGYGTTPHPISFVADGGVFNHNNGTVLFNRSYPTRSNTVIQQINITSVANLNNIEISLGDTHPTGGYNNSILEIAGNPIVVEGNLSHKDGTMNGGSIILGGDLAVFCKYYNGTVCAGGGTTDIAFSSNHIQRYSSHRSSSQGYITITGTAGTFIPAGTAFQSDDGKIFTTDSNVALNNSGTVNAWVTATVAGVAGNSYSIHFVPVENNDNINEASLHPSYPLLNGGQSGEAAGVVINSTSDVLPAEGTDLFNAHHLTVNSGKFISPPNLIVREFYQHGGEFIAADDIFTVGYGTTPHPSHFTVDGGVFNHNTGTVRFGRSYPATGNTVVQQINITSVANLNHMEINVEDAHSTGGYKNSILEVIGNPIIVEGDLAYKDGIINNGNINLSGDLIVSCESYNGSVCAESGSTGIMFNGNQPQDWSIIPSSTRSYITFTGVSATSIPKGTEVQTADGKNFTTTNDITIASNGSGSVWVVSTIPGVDGNSGADIMTLVAPIDGVDGNATIHASYKPDNGGFMGSMFGGDVSIDTTNTVTLGSNVSLSTIDQDLHAVGGTLNINGMNLFVEGQIIIEPDGNLILNGGTTDPTEGNEDYIIR